MTILSKISEVADNLADAVEAGVKAGITSLEIHLKVLNRLDYVTFGGEVIIEIYENYGNRSAAPKHLNAVDGNLRRRKTQNYCWSR